MSVLIPAVYDELIDYLIAKATPEEVIAFQPSEKSANRAEELLERSKEETLTPEEHLELEQMLYFERRVSVLKARAALALKKR